MSAQQLITEHIDLWTSAIKARKTQGRGSSKKRELYGIKKLRELILELAVRGKLVPQDPNDEPASVLLERIAVEKAQLIKDKKIKAQKALLDITKEEAAFELPQGWEWTLLPNISSYKTGKTPATKNSIFWGDAFMDYPWVSIADMNHYGRVVDTTKRVTQEAVEQVFKYPPVKAGTILMSFKLTLGKVSILDVDAFHNEAIISISPFTGVYKDYLFRVLPERALAGNSKKAIKGNTLNSESISRISIPLPPEAEQHRIVAKVDELMALCDQLEQQTESSLNAHNLLVDTLLSTLTDARDAKELSDNWARFMATDGLTAGNAGEISGSQSVFDTLITTDYAVEQLKQTILQLAVMGKLVPQDPNDEPANELLKRIAAEKAQLIKDKKIKKQKPLPVIPDEEKPFELPAGWEWCSLSAICILENGDRGKNYPNKSVLVEDGVPFVNAGHLQEGRIDKNTMTYITEDRFNLLKAGKFSNGDILFCLRGSLGKSAIVDGFKRGAIASSLVIIRLIGSQNRWYLHNYFDSPFSYRQIKQYDNGTAQPNLSAADLGKFLVPVPPTDEQHRIVAKVDELMTLCDQLKAQLNDAQTTQFHLSDAVVENALTA